ncbi:armadillo-type protein [Polychytrium aggregatum]|uniref:armadillo-type protein n=1 Tax=Polychytrium aggregatum TaxID=110093 RepID=UPI0022FF3ACA|nr:armadillo-type protein [Polychytrium aggregatum]KAI9209588.1 armadillo-type protein [Polychytrium aggregatum]
MASIYHKPLGPKEMTECLAATLPPHVDPTKFQLAYGRRAVPKLISELIDEQLFERQRALVFLSDLFHNPENIASALHEGIVPKLTRLLGETDLTVKQKATECMRSLCSHAIGRKSVVDNGTLAKLAKLFDDADPLVRKQTHDIFCRVTSQREGSDSCLSFSLLPVLIKKVPTERMDIQVVILETLYNCIRHGSTPWVPRDAVNNSALDIFTDLIQIELVTDVKVAACRCIMALCFHAEVKKLAVKNPQTIPRLMRLLKDIKPEVRAASAGAIMSITIDCDAKRILVRENAVPIFLELIQNDESQSVLLNVIKCITNCAEDYRGRFQLHSAIKKLENIKESSPNQQLREVAEKAIQVITWRP